MKSVVITGASEGLGLEVAQVFQQNGWRVLGIALEKGDLDIEWIIADLAKQEDIDRVVSFIKKNYSDISVLINNAGIVSVQPLSTVSYEKLVSVISLNEISIMYLVSQLAELLKNNEGDIVNVGSTMGYKTKQGQMAYTASKWALRGINVNLKEEFNDSLVRVIGFNPGSFKSAHMKKATGVEVDLTGMIEPGDLARFLYTIVLLPKNMEVSEVIINRK